MMGERVVIDPASAPPPPRPAVPLDYGHAGSKLSGAEVFVRRLGGWRRIAFAMGAGCLAAAFAYGFSEPRQCDVAGMVAWIGGALVGLAVPIKGLDAPGGG
jgi:hypothetical protein